MMVEPGTELIKYDNARRALQAANSVDEVKLIRDKAVALAAYARMAADVDMQNWASEIRIRAERRAGEMLKEMKEKGERDPGGFKGRGKSGKAKAKPTASRQVTQLKDLGVTRAQSAHWQKIAKIPKPTFERVITNAKERKAELTTSTLLDSVLSEKVRAGSKRSREPIVIASRVFDSILRDCVVIEDEVLPIIKDRKECGEVARRLRDFSKQLLALARAVEANAR